MSDHRVRPGTPLERRRDALIHLSALVPAVVSVAIIGNPALWAGVFLPLGPVLLGRVLAGERVTSLQHRARAIDLNVSVAVFALAVFAILSTGAQVAALSVLIPVGALLLILLSLNWVLLTWVAANRARYGELFDPPWVLPLPTWIRGLPRHDINYEEDEPWPRSNLTI